MKFGSVPAYERDAKETEQLLVANLQGEKYDEPGGPDLHENEAAVWSVHGPVCVLPPAQRLALQEIRRAEFEAGQVVEPIRLPARPTINQQRRAA